MSKQQAIPESEEKTTADNQLAGESSPPETDSLSLLDEKKSVPEDDPVSIESDTALAHLQAELDRQRRQTAEIKARACQQTTVAELGQRALVGTELAVLVDETVSLVAQTLHVERAYILERIPGSDTLVLKAGVGWPEELINQFSLAPDLDTEAHLALQSGTPVIVEDFPAASPTKRLALPAPEQVASLACVVIRGRHRPRGVLGVYSTRPRAFSEDETHFLQAIANIVAMAGQRKQTEAQIVWRNQQLLNLQSAGMALSSNLELPHVLNTVTREMSGLLAVEDLNLYAWDQEAGSLTFLAGEHPEHRLDQEGRGGNQFSLEEYPLVQQCLGQRTARQITTGQAELAPAESAYMQEARLNTWLLLPMIFQERVVGLVEIKERKERTFSGEEIALGQLLTIQAAGAIENSRLYTETRKILKEQIVLRETGSVIASSLDLEMVLSHVARQIGRSLNVTSTYISTFVPESRTSIVLARYVGPEACQTERTPDLGAVYNLEKESADHISFLHVSQPEVTDMDDPDLVEAERHYLKQFEAKTLLSIPMQIAGRTIAYARLWESRKKREFSPEEITQCEAIAQQGAMAIENARLFKQTQNALQETEVLYRVTHALVQTDDEQEMIGLVLTEFLRQLNLRQGGVLYVDGQAYASLQTYMIDGHVASASLKVSLAGTACYEQLTETSAPLIIKDARHDSLLDPVRSLAAEFDLKSVLLTPILVRGEIIGLLAGDAAEINHEFSERDISLAKAMANQLGIAIENKHLQAEAQRRALQLSVLHELDRAITSSLHLKDIYHAFTHHAVRLLPCDHTSITLLEEDDIRVSYVLDEQEALSPGGTLPRQGSAVGWVMTKGQPLLRHNIAADTRHTEDEALVEAGIHSIMVIPLRVKGQVIGTWNLGRQAVGAFGMEDMEIAQSMADQLAITIENARLYDEIHQYLEELHTLNMISQAINSTLDLQKILTLITQHTIRLVGVEAASVVLHDQTRGDLWIAATSGGGSEEIRNIRLELGQGIVGWVVQNGEPTLVPDVTRDDRFYDKFDQITGFTTKSILCVPLQAKGQTIGAVEAINKVNGVFNQEDLRLLGSLVAPAATAIENARLFEQAQQEIAERQRAEAALEKERALLARRVEERTADLSAANAELARAARLKDEFLASMSHELRTPLTAVLGLSDVLKMEVYGPLTEKQMKSINSIEESGRHLLDLINDILDLSKIEAGKLDLDIAPVSIQSICQTSLQFVRQSATRKQLRITSTYDESVSMLMADERRMKQILVNLLSNAVKFTPEGGQVGLEVRGEPERQMVNFIVWDTGIGIAPEDLGRLFQPFVQLDSRLARQYAGTGLGLALVRRMVEMHGGGIAVESELERGSRFTISLPLQGLPSLSKRADGAGRAEIDMSELNSIERVLIIEDSPTAANQLKTYLARLGIKAVTHPEGKAAVEQVLTIEPDVIILDILLPDSSGWDILTQIKAKPGIQEIPVVIVSVVDEPSKGLALGAAECLTKPVTQQQLMEALSRIVQADEELSKQPIHVRQTDPAAPLILLAEDQEKISEFLVDYLEEQQGYRVVVTRNGLEALAQARMEKPDLILMDIQMPEMDGLEATRRLRATDELAETPIIALTALAMPGDQERCFEAGASAYLSKPISLKELGQVIENHLSRDQ